MNQYGLSRHIPADTALQVRQRSRFGCVVCRCAIYQYEHIDPEFANARTHDPEKICLLCGGCHDRVTRGRLSKETIKSKYAEIQVAQDVDAPFEELDLACNDISVVLGTATFHHAKSLIRIDGQDLLSITPPSDGAAFPTLNGVFCDRFGSVIFRVIDNVWQGSTDAWDIEIVGSNVTIRAEEHRPALSFDIIPPRTIQVRTLDMYINNCHIVCDEKQLLVGQTFGSKGAYIGLGNFTCSGAIAGISVDSRTRTTPIPTGISIAGGQGVSIDGTGISVGVGAGSMLIAEMKVWVA